MIIKKNSFVGSFSSRHSLSQKNHRSEVCIRFPVQPAQAPTELCLGLDAWHQECVLFTKLCYGGNEYKLTLTSWNSLNFISIPVLFVKKNCIFTPRHEPHSAIFYPNGCGILSYLFPLVLFQNSCTEKLVLLSYNLSLFYQQERLRNKYCGTNDTLNSPPLKVNYPKRQ